MNIIKVIIGLLLGLFIGMMVNGSLINIGMKVFPFPNGVNFSTPEGMKAFITLPLHYYMFPFLAHALGTLCGCLAGLLVFKEKAKKVCIPHWLFIFYRRGNGRKYDKCSGMV